MTKPLVTVTIPSFNSGKTIERCLKAIREQTYKHVEINIIDGGGDDGTRAVAVGYKANHRFYPGSLLAARYEGVKMAKGRYTLILDSDQIISKNAIEGAVGLCETQGLDMIVFEEDVFRKDTFIEKLFALDRKLINTVNDLSPYTGVIMPRFFRTSILLKAYQNVPKKYFKSTGGPDHAIIYYEASLLTAKIETFKDAVKHIEPSNIFTLWRKFFRWGYTSIDAHYGKYTKLMQQKERFRTGLFSRGLFVESLGSIMLLVLKGTAYKFGYLLAKIK